MKTILKMFIVNLYIFFIAESLYSLTAVEILNKIDKNEHVKTISFKARMIITNGYRVMVKKMIGIAEDSDKSYSYFEFINPEDEGVKYLKIDNEMWISSPDADEIVKISGHLLKESMMGSDMSYEDATANDRLVDIYNARILGEEKIEDHDCYKLELIAKEKKKKIPYYKRIIWVDKNRFVVMKENLYAVSGKLMKISTVEKVDKIGSRYYPTISKMKNLLKRNSATVFILDDIKIDVKIDRNKFSKQGL